MMTTLIPSVRIKLCDDNNIPAVFLSQFSEWSYTERINGRDSFEVTVPRSAPHADMLTPGRLIITQKTDDTSKQIVLIVKQVSVDSDSVTASGCDYLWELFAYRLVVAGLVTSDRLYDDATDSQTGAAETVARHYIEYNLTSATDTSRQDSNVTLETAHSPALGGEVTIDARLDTLAEVLETCCIVGNIGIEGILVEDSTAQGWHIEIQITEGTDRSQTE